MKNKMDELKGTQPEKEFRILKSMGSQPGDCADDHSFDLPNHQLLRLKRKVQTELQNFLQQLVGNILHSVWICYQKE